MYCLPINHVAHSAQPAAALAPLQLPNLLLKLIHSLDLEVHDVSE